MYVHIHNYTYAGVLVIYGYFMDCITSRLLMHSPQRPITLATVGGSSYLHT